MPVLQHQMLQPLQTLIETLWEELKVARLASNVLRDQLTAAQPGAAGPAGQ